MGKGSSTDRPAVTAEASDNWSVLLRMKVSNTAAGCGLQVSSGRAYCAFKCSRIWPDAPQPINPKALCCNMRSGSSTFPLHILEHCSKLFYLPNASVPAFSPLAWSHMLSLPRCAGLDPTPWLWQPVRTRLYACCNWTQMITTCWTSEAQIFSAAAASEAASLTVHQDLKHQALRRLCMNLGSKCWRQQLPLAGFACSSIGSARRMPLPPPQPRVTRAVSGSHTIASG